MEKEWKAYEIGELDQYLFGQGNHYEIYKKLGAHMVDDEVRKEFILLSGHRMQNQCLQWGNSMTGIAQETL